MTKADKRLMAQLLADLGLEIAHRESDGNGWTFHDKKSGEELLEMTGTYPFYNPWSISTRNDQRRLLENAKDLLLNEITEFAHRGIKPGGVDNVTKNPCLGCKSLEEAAIQVELHGKVHV